MDTREANRLISNLYSDLRTKNEFRVPRYNIGMNSLLCPTSEKNYKHRTEMPFPQFLKYSIQLLKKI